MKKLSFKTKIKIPLIGDLLATFKLIQWPTVKDLALNMVAVLVVSAIIGLYLWILDSTFGNLRNVILFN